MFHYGGNFKSVFLETITRVLGDSFAIGLPTESLIGGAEASPTARVPISSACSASACCILDLPNGVKLKAHLIKNFSMRRQDAQGAIAALVRNKVPLKEIVRRTGHSRNFVRLISRCDGTDVGGALKKLVINNRRRYLPPVDSKTDDNKRDHLTKAETSRSPPSNKASQCWRMPEPSSNVRAR